MNVFVLDRDPITAATYQCDKHVVKMILESAQLLFTAHRVLDPNKELPEGAYKATHINHPCAKWVREGSENYYWLFVHFLGLCDEYAYRYGKTHKTQAWLSYLALLPENIPWYPHMMYDIDTPFVLAMPDEYKTDDPVQSYRNYYLGAKKDLLTYTRREPPEWAKSVATFKP